MSEFQLKILGCGSATPTRRHMPSCQAVIHRGKVMLVDCGEGAQVALNRNRVPNNRITDIFISHLHGDHLLGLPGLLSTMMLKQRGGEVTVHIFAEGAEMLKHVLDVVAHDSEMMVRYNIIPPQGGLIYEDKSLTVTAFRLRHSVPCVGFRFDEKPKPRHIDGDMVRFLGVPVCMLNGIRNGDDYVRPDGEVVPNSRMTTDPTPSVSYAYCSDTVFDPSLVDRIGNVDYLYHEATYTSEYADAAFERGHSTAAQAARIARQAGAGHLILGHFSSRYADEEGHLAEAAAIFPDTVIAAEGMTIDFD